MQIICQKMQKVLPHSKIDIFGSDQLLHNVFPYYLLVTTIILSYILGLQAGFPLIFLTFTILPLLDEIFNLDSRNPTYQQAKQLQKHDKYFKVVLYVTAIIDWIWFFRCIQIFSETELTLPNTIKLIAFVFIFGFFNALQFSVAHQLIHKQGLIHRFLGTFHILKNFYIHYPYTHLYSHHRKVATPQDPATASKGKSLYKFFPITFLGTFTTVYDMEKKKGKPFITNYCVLSIISSVIFISLILKFYGVQAAIFFVIQAFISIFILQIANYIQHYGLERQKLADGTYEKVTIRHSWNAPHRFSNYLLFKVQRHSDHHVNIQKPYQTLLSLDQSPQLPHGYTVCIFLSLFPSRWFKIMDPVLEQYRKTKNANMSGQVMQRALKETRKFIIQLGIYTTLGLLTVVTLQ